MSHTEHHCSSLQDEGRVIGEVWIELSILIFHEHKYLQPCRTDVQWMIFSRSPDQEGMPKLYGGVD